MQKLQLYIDSQRVELFKDETVSLTQTIQNVRDIKKVFTEFTQTFSVPASKTNNIIFEHYYNYNIINGFDARNKVAAKLELNNLPFKDGFISLQGVDLKNNLAHTYKITFYGNTVNLKDILGDDQLSSLSQLDNYSLEYSEDNILSKFIINPKLSLNTEIITPLITHTQPLRYNSNSTVPDDANGNLFYNSAFINNGVYWKELKFALKLPTIISAIQDKYTLVNGYASDIVFSSDFFNNVLNTDFDDLYMWLHRKKGNVDTASEGFSWTTLTELTETDNIPPTANFSSVQNGILSISSAPLVQSILTLTPSNGIAQYSSRVIDGTGAVVAQIPNVTGTTTYFSGNPLGVGTYSVEIASVSGVTFDADNVVWDLEFDDDGQGFGGITIYKNEFAFSSTDSTEFNITQQIPKMKVIDFLSAIFQMFNLTSYVDNSGTIVVKTLDSYYAAGSSIPINIDRYLDTEKSQVNIALPFKNIIFGYKGLGTILAEKYNQLSNIEWGTLKYADEQNEFSAPAESYEIEIPFEHMQFERLNNVNGGSQTNILYGVFVDDNLDSYYGEPLVFYPNNGAFTGGQTTIAFRKDGGTASDVVSVSTYNMPSNSQYLDSFISAKNINFRNEINEYSLGTNFTKTLFNEYYINYIKDVFNPSRRLTKVTAYLPMKIFYNLKLNDLIQLGQNNYKINSLTTNLTTGKTEFELLNYDIEYINQLDILLDALEARADYFENKSCTAETLNELKQIQ